MKVFVKKPVPPPPTDHARPRPPHHRSGSWPTNRNRSPRNTDRVHSVRVDPMAEGSDVETGQEESIGCYPVTARLVYANLTPKQCGLYQFTHQPTTRQRGRAASTKGDCSGGTAAGLEEVVTTRAVGGSRGRHRGNHLRVRLVEYCRWQTRGPFPKRTARSPNPADPQDLSPRASDREGLMTCC